MQAVQSCKQLHEKRNSPCILLMERMSRASRKHRFYSGWLMVDSNYMLSRLVVSLITLNICGVRYYIYGYSAFCYQSIVLLIVFIETCYSCRIAYGFMLV